MNMDLRVSKSLRWVDYCRLEGTKMGHEFVQHFARSRKRSLWGRTCRRRELYCQWSKWWCGEPGRRLRENTLCYDWKKRRIREHERRIPVSLVPEQPRDICAMVDSWWSVVKDGHWRRLIAAVFGRPNLIDRRNWQTVRLLVRSRHGPGLAISYCRCYEHVSIAACSGKIGGRTEHDSTEVYI